jgi:hypothetical protein
MGTAAEYVARAARLRKARPPDWMRDWQPGKHRDPLAALDRAAAGREPELVARRNAEMADDTFTFLRGAAGIMAGDLADRGEAVSGITVTICRDAHASNFGLYGSPERIRVFDLNDFDEAGPGPWEWDVCRLGASVAVAGRHLDDEAKERAAACAVSAYASTVGRLARAPIIDRWYDLLAVGHIEADWLQQGDEPLPPPDDVLAARAKNCTQAETVKHSVDLDNRRSTTRMTSCRSKARRCWIPTLVNYRNTVISGL